MRRRIGYCRTSSTRQHLDLQLAALAAAGVAEADIYTEQVSGASKDRPVLETCLANLEPGDCLVVWRLDRLGRSLPHLLAITANLGERGIGFESIHDRIDTTNATGKLIFHVLAAISQFERDLTTERINAGLDAAKARGQVLGRRTVVTPAKLRAIADMSERGVPRAEIARAIGVSRATLYRHLDA